MLSSATVTLGCKSFLDAQAKSCYCAGGPTSGDGGKNANSNSNNPKDAGSNKNTNKNNKQQRNNYKPTNGGYNTYPNNIRQEARHREEPPSYGWKDKRDL